MRLCPRCDEINEAVNAPLPPQQPHTPPQQRRPQPQAQPKKR